MKLRRHIAVMLLAAAMVLTGLPATAFAAESEGEYTLTPVGSHEPYTVSLNYETPEALLSEMRQVAVNDSFELYIHDKNLVAAVRDLRSGALYFTNPYNAAQDTYYTESIRKGLESQIVIQYAGTDGQIVSLWSSEDCANFGQAEIQTIENGVEVTMSIGEEKERRLIPQAVAADRFEEKILSHFDPEERAYRRLKEVLYTKTTGDNGEIYIVRKLTNREQDEVEGYMLEAGYTYEDMDADHAANNVTVESVYFPNFQLKLRYTLTENGLSFSIPADSIRYDDKHFHLVSIKALEYFGAVCSREEHEGYILMPDGSGTLVDFRASAGRQMLISGQVYGYDAAVTYPEVPRQGRTFHLPVFGIKQDDHALFAIITEGAGLSTISAYAGTHLGEYFAAFPTFAYTTREELLLERRVTSHGSSSIDYLYDDNVYVGNYTVEYAFLNGGDSTYTGMAHYYQKYLERQGMTRLGTTETSLAVETIGTLNYTDKFLGIPYQAAAKLTTFEQNREILEALQERGVEHLSLTLEAWRNGGLDSTLANRLDPSSALGGKRDFLDLAQWCTEQNIAFYPNYDLIYVAEDKWFDGFSANRDTIRLMNDKLGGWMTVRPDTSMYDKSTFAYGLNPLKYASALQSLLGALDKAKVSSVGLGTLGTALNSNFSEKQQINREQNVQQIRVMLAGASEGRQLQFDGANAYVLPYADSVHSTPMTSSNYKGTTSVPFLQLVLNGMIPYSSEPINTEHDMQAALLRCIECGASPHYMVAQDNIQKIKLTEHTEYYSIDAAYWMDTMAEGYRTVSTALAPTGGSVITDHTVLDDGLVRVEYENGVRIYINYNDADAEADGIMIPANGYRSVQGGM